MAGSIAGSYAFLILTKSAMANDFWWASFDTDTQTYLSNWFNNNLQLTNVWHNVAVANPTHGAFSTTTNQTAPLVNVAPTYANAIQDEVNTLQNVVYSLRQMDGCMLPWIMTAYCYVDFNRSWEMASTGAKQLRCTQDHTNGAIYLESVLRNADWPSLSQCWGQALETGVFGSVKSTSAGKTWVSMTLTHRNSISDEVYYWQTASVTHYSTQWQNYKRLGIIETFSIENAYGHTYPLTLKYSNGSFQLASSTSLKMQRPLANELSQLVGNTSSQFGRSLLRDDPNYIYANNTLRNSLIDAGYLMSPLGPGFNQLQNILGPFGSINMKRIPCPNILRFLYQNLTSYSTNLLGDSNLTQSAFWPIYSSFTMAPIPNSWQSLSFRGGNLLCELTQAASLQNRVQILFSSSGSCASNVFETMVGDTTTIMKVILSLTKPNVTAIKFQEQFNSPASSKLISQTLTFVQTYVPPIELLNFQLHARRVKLYLRDEVNISMVQYVWNTNGYALATLNYFDPMEVDFEFFAWLFMFDWVQGIREVVSFEGDTGNLTTMSTSTTFQIAVNPMEIPLNIANYMRWFLQYITWVMLGVACLVCFYIIGLRGQIEASNMISFSRVTSLVWIGRPLILLRALSAVCLLV
ncbi:Aste57867_5698 [Aphanomyces stellatus]|uniref:Aste57867_5698 protein n=1 Tax=Aphanomyces stellatus TaxID=120398 RepID=A0A485KEV6_9STRA|nr:hypothetical protein As57867_005685 [Aphanomyces stellatus]VFT82738.1 Aste57867_5698 [Aphanomyces stellatus]